MAPLLVTKGATLDEGCVLARAVLWLPCVTHAYVGNGKLAFCDVEEINKTVVIIKWS
jgi:hypothetical protein